MGESAASGKKSGGPTGGEPKGVNELMDSGGRQRLNFDRDWIFHLGDLPIQHAVKSGLAGGLTDDSTVAGGDWLKRAYSDPRIAGGLDDEWVQVALPHDWLIGQPYSETADWTRGFIAGGIGLYRKTFEIPAKDLGKKISLQFDGVMRNSTVWVNGHRLGTHVSGYTGFQYDVTDVLRYGDEGRNVVLVRVDATEHEGWWYDGAGIYRHVWLVKTHRLHVGVDGIFVTSPEVSAAEAAVKVRTILVNELPETLECVLTTDLVDANGRIVATSELTATIGGDSDQELSSELTVQAPHLWAPAHPYVYQVISRVRLDDQAVDSVRTAFGIRTLQFTADRGFLLNGEYLEIRGVACHQNFAGVGVAMPDRIIAYRLELLKAMGANAYRSAHHPPTPELLDLCDRMGILVMDENRRLDSSEEGVRDLESMIRRDRNHPSVFLWSLENEEDLQGTPMGARILETLVRTAHRLDPTRPVTAAMNKRRNDAGYADLLDVVGYNYGQTLDSDVRDHRDYPERRILGSESAAFVSTRGVYADDEEKGYCSSYGTEQAFCAPDTSGWCTTPERAVGDVVRYPFLTGVFIWSGFDYRGEPSPYRWPNINSHFGIMDMCGFPKDCYYYYRAAWNDDPVVHIFPHWNWLGREGEEIRVWAHSNCETVELFLNGSSLGERSVPSPPEHLEWRVPYRPGALRAVGKRGGREAVVDVVETTGPPARIQIEADRTALAGDGLDVSVLKVSIRDAAGRVVPLADNQIQFTAEGSGRVLGTGNGDPSSHESDLSHCRKAFNGYCLALVQTTGDGPIAVRAESEGLLPAVTVFQAGP